MFINIKINTYIYSTVEKMKIKKCVLLTVYARDLDFQTCLR